MVAIIGGGASYAVGRERVRGTDLQALYDQINRDSFRGALPPVSVKWGYLDDAYGRTYYDEEEIVIDRASVTSEGMLRETMRHEACHVATRQAVIDGEDDHGAAWQACMERFK